MQRFNNSTLKTGSFKAEVGNIINLNGQQPNVGNFLNG